MGWRVVLWWNEKESRWILCWWFEEGRGVWKDRSYFRVVSSTAHLNGVLSWYSCTCIVQTIVYSISSCHWFPSLTVTEVGWTKEEMGTTKKYFFFYQNIKLYFEMVNPVSQNVVLDDKCYKHMTWSAKLPHTPSVGSDLINCFGKCKVCGRLGITCCCHARFWMAAGRGTILNWCEHCGTCLD